MSSRPFIGRFNITAVSTKVFDLQNAPIKRVAIQVKGVGAAPTTWSVNVEGSIDGVNWTVLVTHANADVDGTTKFDTTDKPVIFIRINATSVTLGPASSINADVVGVE